MNKKFKYAVANFFRFIPDSLMLRVQYFIKLKRWLRLSKPQRFTEWIQWYKAYYRNPTMLECTDKYKVRDYVSRVLGTEKYLNTLLQLCDTPKDIDFSTLPNRFVIKTTDGGNGDNVFICTNKDGIDFELVISQLEQWRFKRYENLSREWAYLGARDSKIIVESYLEDLNSLDGSIDDYKFLCFDGKFRYLWIDKNRYSDHRRGFWDEKLNFLPNVSSDHPTFATAPELPANIHEMIQLSEKLAAPFKFARVDWYNIDEEIIFGEITFYPWSGYCQYNPDEFDFMMGKYFN